jgi:N-formylglutamate amidohydrolase
MTVPVTKREAARGLLTAMFRERPRILIAEIMDAAAERAISRRTMTRACGDLGITEIHNGPFGGIWAWPQDQHPSS